jgi:pimeloyl-ACP methyl ester carboxylesterase
MTAGTAKSADGTRIAFWRDGQGPPLLLVHGGACDHLAWYFVVPVLAQAFTVYTYDRRGHGESGNVLPYAVEREVEDVEAMLVAIGEPAHLLGHSAGGILALEAAERVDNLLSLILYEPAYVVPGARERPNPEVLGQMNALLSTGNRAEVVRIAIRETLGLSRLGAVVQRGRCHPIRLEALGPRTGPPPAERSSRAGARAHGLPEPAMAQNSRGNTGLGVTRRGASSA